MIHLCDRCIWLLNKNGERKKRVFLAHVGLTCFVSKRKAVCWKLFEMVTCFNSNSDDVLASWAFNWASALQESGTKVLEQPAGGVWQAENLASSGYISYSSCLCFDNSIVLSRLFAVNAWTPVWSSMSCTISTLDKCSVAFLTSERF